MPHSPGQIEKVKSSIDTTLAAVGSFQLLEPRVVPEGLKQIARSMSWLMEQVVVQNLRLHREVNGLLEVADPPNNLTQYDCVLTYPSDDTQYFLNVKTSLVQTALSGRFDVSKAPKLIEFYSQNPEALLILAIIKVEMNGTSIRFDRSYVFNVAWIRDIYYNRANHNLQTTFDGSIVVRTNGEFATLLSEKIAAAGHTSHY